MKTYFQNQGLSLLSIIFFGGASWANLNAIKDDLAEMKNDVELIHKIETKTQVQDLRIRTIEKWMESHKEKNKEF